MLLKTEMHCHVKGDPVDKIKYSAKELILLAAKLKYEVMSITPHLKTYSNEEMIRFAKENNILLISGKEAKIQGKEVLIYDYTGEINKLEELDKVQQENGLVIAPHPFFVMPSCLGRKLEKNINNFDAIEYCHFYSKKINFNRKAEILAKKYNKPMIGTSDAHNLYEFGATYSILDCEKDKDSVLEAIRKNKIRIITKPMTTFLFTRRLISCFIPNFLRF